MKIGRGKTRPARRDLSTASRLRVMAIHGHFRASGARPVALVRVDAATASPPPVPRPLRRPGRRRGRGSRKGWQTPHRSELKLRASQRTETPVNGRPATAVRGPAFHSGLLVVNPAHAGKNIFRLGDFHARYRPIGPAIHNPLRNKGLRPRGRQSDQPPRQNLRTLAIVVKRARQRL